MNILERITKTVEVGQLNWYGRDDVLYLLSIIEQQEGIIKGMESAIKPCVHEDGHTLNWDQVKLRINRYVNEALQVIRGK